VLRVIRELLFCEPIGRGTSIRKALEHLNKTVKRRSVVFLISDFQDSGYEKALRVARKRHDIIPIVVGDQREFELPNVGLVELQDSETGEIVMVDTSSAAHRKAFAKLTQEAGEKRDKFFTKLKMDPVNLRTGGDFIEPIRKLFHKRGAKRAR
jgi:hypothetical protein